jgi:hypothetical protein
LFEWSVPAIKAAGGRASIAQHNQGTALKDLYEATTISPRWTARLTCFERRRPTQRSHARSSGAT